MLDSVLDMQGTANLGGDGIEMVDVAAFQVMDPFPVGNTGIKPEYRWLTPDFSGIAIDIISSHGKTRYPAHKVSIRTYIEDHLLFMPFGF